MEFERNLENNLFQLHYSLKNKTYQHGGYHRFHIYDPKFRVINKASVRDRVLHHAIYRVLYPIFDKTYIHDSYSCRISRGTHRSVKRLENFTRKVSKNYTKPCFALKCDIRKFFDSVDQETLFKIIKKKIQDREVLLLIWEIIQSYLTNQLSRGGGLDRKGIPLGNLTSQLFANIYLDKLDQFIKHQLKIKCYLRYSDDFVLIANNIDFLKSLIPQIDKFLDSKLKLKLHPNKIIIKKLRQGIDFLGYVVLPRYTVLRAKTRRRMLKRVNKNNLSSYLGLIKHCRGYELKQEIFIKLGKNSGQKGERIELLDII